MSNLQQQMSIIITKHLEELNNKADQLMTMGSKLHGCIAFTDEETALYNSLEPEENSLTKNVLLTIMGCITTKDAVAPNLVGESVFELLTNADVSEEIAEKISDAAQALAAELVVDPPNYL